MVRKVVKVSLCALLLSTVSVLGACGDDDSSEDGTEDGDDGTEADAGDDDGGDDGEPDAGADSGLDEVTQEGEFVTIGPDGMNPIKGSLATLVRTPEGVEVTMTVPELEAGNVYTMWWTFFQNPEACLTDPKGEIKCNPNDSAGGPTPDPEVYTATQGAFVYGIPAPEGGVVADEKGTVTITRSYAANTDPTEGIYVTAGEDKGYWEGLTDVMKAEIHVAFRDHGPASKDPDILNEQLTTFTSSNCDPDQDGPMKGDPCGTVAAKPFPSVTLNQ
jgi:hypothetical protein